MNSPLSLAVGFALLALPTLAADSRSAVEKAERDWAAAVVKSDIATLERLLATDLVYTHSSGNRDTRASFIETARTGKLRYEKLDHQKIGVQMIKGDVAFVAARAEVRVVSGGKPVDMRVSLLHVWVKRQGRWQLVAHQSARMP